MQPYIYQDFLDRLFLFLLGLLLHSWLFLLFLLHYLISKLHFLMIYPFFRFRLVLLFFLSLKVLLLVLLALLHHIYCWIFWLFLYIVLLVVIGLLQPVLAHLQMLLYLQPDLLDILKIHMLHFLQRCLFFVQFLFLLLDFFLV